ncbi:phosphate signaling complex PhoU family protein [Rubrobacter calidifluminis]|uniref:phosphate signaling complex PhoU family protein n=1 Tax=Rubrobacter calidifluminis TaxID=1392640 RepID=UPI00235FD5AC|nr:PhoU domain-containing protein [Rubrobacter calidifluminis]
MPREIFQRELDGLIEEVMEFGDDVCGSLELMVRSMEDHDAGLARRVVGSDARYKARGAEIDAECMVLQARQAPVARDLRLLHTLQGVTNHLVRSGTLCEHICAALVETEGHERDLELERTLVEMAALTRDLLREGLVVFREREVDRARNLQATDDRVDLLYSEALNLIANPPEDRPGSPEWRMRAALIAHYLERIADHGVDIGAGTVFLVTGERIEEAVNQYLQRND